MAKGTAPRPTQTYGSVTASTLLMAGAQALSLFSGPGPKRATKQDFVVNPGDAADVVPYICGTVKTTPHFVTYFDFASRKVKNDVAIKDMLLNAGLSGLSGYLAGGGHFGGPVPDPPTAYLGLAEGTVLGAIIAGLGQLRTASYRYYCGFLYEFCHGPIDEVQGIYVDKRLVSNGGPAGNSILIDDPQAWGGDHVDGGFYAYCDIIKGDFFPTQQPNPYLKTILGANVTALNGKAGFVIRGPSGFRESGYFAATASGAPTLRPIEFIILRLPNNLGVPAYKNINSGDANPAECAYEWLTSPVFGAKKLNINKIDVASFQSAAQTHHTDGVGCSLEFNSKIDVETALAKFTGVGNAIIFKSLGSGVIRYKIIKRDYSIGSLPVFRRGKNAGVTDPSDFNVTKVEGYTPGSWAATASEYQFDYIDRLNQFQTVTRYVRDTANYEMTLRAKVLSMNLDGISTGDTAALVGTRELRAGSYPRPSFTLFVNREGFDKEPGDTILYIDDVLGFEKVARIGEVQELASVDTGMIGLICAEDQFGVGDAAYTAPPAIGWVDPIGEGAEASISKVIESPYALSHDDDPRLFMFAASPDNAHVNYDAYVSIDSGLTYGMVGHGIDFAVVGALSTDILRLTPETIDGIIFTPENTFEAAALVNATPAEIAVGSNWIYFESTGEFMAVETITDNGDGTFTLDGVWRAIGPLDSVPNPHSMGERVWFFSYGRLVTSDEYANGTATRTKILPRTVSSQLTLAVATAINFTTDTRAIRPNPVRGVTIDADYLKVTIGAGDDINLGWSETNRLTEGGAIKQTTAGVTPEDGTTYTVRYYATESGSVLLHTESGIAASTGSVTDVLTTAEEIASGGYLGHLSDTYRIEIDVVRDGKISTTYIRELDRAARHVGLIDVSITVIAPSQAVSLAVPTLTVTIEVTEINSGTPLLNEDGVTPILNEDGGFILVNP